MFEEISSKSVNDTFHPDEYLYDIDGLRFIRSRLETFDLYCFYLVVLESSNGGGLHKTKIENYYELRTKIDNAFIKFDAQGLVIEQKEHRVRNGRPYVLTSRGVQFYNLFKDEILHIIGGNNNDI